MRIYYFTQKKYALDCIFSKKIKVCLLENANDPFEYMPQSMGCDMERFIENLALHEGIICFSESYKSPIMWGHYAQNHTGICLCFEIDRNELIKVKYKNEREPSNIVLEKGLKKLSIKSKSWAYEKEQRIRCILNKSEQIGHDLFFMKFKDLNIELKEILLGVRCQTDIISLQRTIDNKYQSSIPIYETRLSKKYYKIKKDKCISIEIMTFINSIESYRR